MGCRRDTDLELIVFLITHGQVGTLIIEVGRLRHVATIWESGLLSEEILQSLWVETVCVNLAEDLEEHLSFGGLGLQNLR